MLPSGAEKLAFLCENTLSIIISNKHSVMKAIHDILIDVQESVGSLRVKQSHNRPGKSLDPVVLGRFELVWI